MEARTQPDASWDYRTTQELVAALQARKISAIELTDHVIARIEALDPNINAVVVRDFDRGRAAAKTADAALSRGEQRPLLGIPMVIKESFDVVGLPTTWGISAFRDYMPKNDALAVTRVKAAGAVILGKTNVPLMNADWQSYNDIYGTTNNPWDLGSSPGGSSGGSSAALAAGFGPLSLGSDTGGSLRCPAHYCGVYAHKPTLNLVPMRGHAIEGATPYVDDLGVIGPMARSAADLALTLEVTAGPDEAHAGIAYRLALPAPRHEELRAYRVLVIDDHPLLPTTASVRAALNRLAQRLVKSGVEVAHASPLVPDLAVSARLFTRLLVAPPGREMAAGTLQASAGRGREAQAGRQQPRGRKQPRRSYELSRLGSSHRGTNKTSAAMARAVPRMGCGALPADADARVSSRPFDPNIEAKD
jgi:amidase